MKEKILVWIFDRRWFLGFTAVFSALMAFVFWGTWSPEVSAVMPDDSVCHPLSYGAQLRGAINGFLSSGMLVPGDIFGYFPIVSKYWLQEFKYAFAAYCAALGLVYFLRGRGLSQISSYGGGLLLGFCGYWLTLFSAGHAGWFYWMTYGVFAFGLVDRAVRFGALRHWILSGACVAWASFYQPDLWLLFTVLTGLYTLLVCACVRKFPWKGLLAAALTFAVIGAPSVRGAFGSALSGRDKQIAETVKPLSEAEKADPAAKAKAEREARWIFVTNWSLPPSETVEFFNSRVNGDTSCPMTLQCARAAGKDTRPYTGALGRPLGASAGNYRQHSLYVGWVTCLLALAGLAGAFLKQPKGDDDNRNRSRAVVVFFAVAAFVCWLLSLGRNCEPVYRIVFALPFGDYLRAPVKWHHLTELCLCVLAGYGLEGLSRFAAGTCGKLGRLLPLAAVLVGAVDLARVDRLYCAPIDMHIVHGGNAAADFVTKAGGGKVADLVEQGNGLLSWSLRAHEVSVTGNPGDEGVRFLWVGTQQVTQNKSLESYVKSRATLVGSYLATGKGVFSVQPINANVALYQVNGVPAPEKRSPWGKVDWGVLAMGLASVLGTVFALALAAFPARFVSSAD